MKKSKLGAVKSRRVICTCAQCNKPYSDTDGFSDYRLMRYGETGIRPEGLLCRECFDRAISAEQKRRDTVAEKRTCKDCLRVFPITVGEAEWFAEKEFTLPVRCPVCRARRRAERLNAGKATVTA